MRLFVAEEPLQGLHVLLCDIIQAPKPLVLLVSAHLVEVRDTSLDRYPGRLAKGVRQSQAGVQVRLRLLREV